MDIYDLLRQMVQESASDLFIKVGTAPGLRINGKVRLLEGAQTTSDMAQEFYEKLADARVRRMYEADGEVDTAITIDGIGRFRINIFRQQNQTGMVFRHVKSVVPTLEELNLPVNQLKKIASIPRGLVLVTGITGSGKSSTLAAMVEYINSTMRKHVVTIEDPIEFIFEDKRSIIDQREIGIDTRNFVSALKHVVRQNPDIILLGEIRDKETIDAAITAAETGHLVMSTLHTLTAMQTVERIMNFYPPHQQDFVKEQLSLVMEGVISQRLVPKKTGDGRLPAVELMLATPSVREILHEGKTRDLYKAIKEGGYFGCQTFNQALKGMLQQDLITVDDALANANNPDELKLEIRGIQKGTKSAGDFEFKNF